MPILGITSSGVDTTTTVNNLFAEDISTPAPSVFQPQLVHDGLDLNIKVERFLVTTSGSTQDFDIAAFGTPKGAWFIASSDQADGLHTANETNFPGISWGGTDGTNEVLVAIQGEDGSTTNLTREYHTTNYCAGLLEYGTAGGLDMLTFDSWTANGVRLAKSAISRNFLMTVVLFSGDDFDMAVGRVDLKGTVSGLSFKPNLLWGSMGEPAFNTVYNLIRTSMGFAWDTGAGTTELCQGTSHSNGQNPPSSNSAAHSDDYAYLAGGGSHHSNVSSWNSDGLALSAVDSTGSFDVAYMAMRFGGGVSLSTEVTPTTPTTKVKSGLAFQPGFLCSICTDAVALDTIDYVGVGLPRQFSVADGTNEYIHGWCEQDGTSPTNTWTFAAQKTVLTYEHSAGTKQAEAVLTSFNADGWTETYSTAPASAQYLIQLAVETS